MYKFIKISVGATRFIVSYKNVYPKNELNTLSSSRYKLKSVLRDFVYKHLTSYNYEQKSRRFIPDKHFSMHDKDKMRYRFPVSLLDRFIAYMKLNGYDVVPRNRAMHTPRKIDYQFKFKLRDNQKKAVDYALEGYKTMRCLELPTGFGKTVCAINVACKIGNPFMVVVNGLLDQWEERILEATNIKKEEIARIQAIDSINDLMNHIHKGALPKVLLCTMSTLRNLCVHEGNYSKLPVIQTIIDKCGIGLKIVDEAHLMFHASCTVDLSCDVRYNLYLTATFNNDNKSLNRVFNNYYHPGLRMTVAPECYTDVYAYSYLIRVCAKRCVTNYGYSHAKYEKLLLRQDNAYGYYHNVILPLLDHYYFANDKMKGKRALIFCGTVDMIDTIVHHIKKTVMDEYSVSRYTADEPESVLSEYDIIVATMKGCGVGNDIPNLSFVLNTVSFKGYNMTKQAFGRLRKPKDGEKNIYVDIRNVAIPSHEMHYINRRKLLTTISKSYSECNL